VNRTGLDGDGSDWLQAAMVASKIGPERRLVRGRRRVAGSTSCRPRWPSSPTRARRCADTWDT
jgi:hypothetical protein